MRRLRQDLCRAGYRSLPRALLAALYRPELRAVVLFRLQEFLELRGLRPAAQLVVNANQVLTGAEFVLGCRIGIGLVVKHPNGIVIGKGAVIGSNCTLLHQVTVGERHLTRPGAGVYPRIGNDVVLGVKCSVLGDVTVGNSAVIGAHALVLADVDPGATVVGVHTARAPDARR